MRLIDADAFDKMLIEAQSKCKSNFRFGVLGDVRGNLVLFPTVDRPEIVRCKDCKYAHKTYDGDCKYCDMFTDDDGNPIERYRSGDWFCADGERAKNARLSSSEIPNS